METAPPVEPYIDPITAPKSGWAESGFVWGVAVVMLTTAFWFVRTYGNPVPFVDEWAHVEILTGAEPVTAAWLWKPHGEHRVPLAKLMWISVVKWTGSFKVGVYINVLLFGLVTLAMIRAAQKLPGGLHLTDALLPMLLLHVGQGYDLQWWWEIILNLPCVVIGFLIAAVVRGGPRLVPAAALACGLCLLILPFCGPSGLPCAIAMSLWLGAWGVRSLTEGDGSRVAGLTALVMAVATLAFVALHFVGLKKPDHMPASPGHWETARTAAQFLSVSVGAGASFWWKEKAVLVCVILLSTCLLLVVVWWRYPDHHFRITGLLILTGAIFPLALSLGWGRAYNGDRAGLSHWYTIFGVPSLCAAYFAWRLYAPPTLGRFVRAWLFAGACMMLALNMVWSRDFFASEKQKMSAFMTDLNDGVILPVLADRHTPFLFQKEHASIYWAPMVKQLHDAGYPVFRPLVAPDFNQLDLPYTFERANQATWKDSVAIGTGTDPFLVFKLERPQFVYAVQLWFSYRNTHNPVTCGFDWRNSRENDFGDHHQTWEQDTTLELISRTIVVNDTIDGFRIDPAKAPCEFHLKRVLFLVRK